MKRILFIDCIGTILIEDASGRYTPAPQVILNLSKIVNDLDYLPILLVSSDRKAETAASVADQKVSQNIIISLLKNEGIIFADIVTYPSAGETLRVLQNYFSSVTHRYREQGYTVSDSYIITAIPIVYNCAQKYGLSVITFGGLGASVASLYAQSWSKVYAHLKTPPRVSEVKRKTKETSICMIINLDGDGTAAFATPYGFLTHMLELFAFHAGCTLTGQIDGDTQVDEHHTVEDTAIALGTVLRQALGNKTGIERYGFVLPMDESCCQMALDFCGRAVLVWDVMFIREKIGDLPTELFHHFFKSMSNAAQCTLHIQAYGTNEHHKIEAIFKAFGRCVRSACSRTGNAGGIPSTKGML